MNTPERTELNFVSVAGISNHVSPLRDTKVTPFITKAVLMRILTSLIAAGAIAVIAAPASAAVTLYSYPGPSADMLSPGSIDAQFNAGAGAATLTFDVLGRLSLDGFGSAWVDTFTLSLNGTDIYRAQFPLGGEGGEAVLLAPTGATQTVINNGFFQGGKATINVPLTLVQGQNTLTFAYAGAPQGAGDESWALSGVAVSGEAFVSPAGVPEPATWAMMLLGFFGMGAALRRRRQLVA